MIIIAYFGGNRGIFCELLDNTHICATIRLTNRGRTERGDFNKGICYEKDFGFCYRIGCFGRSEQYACFLELIPEPEIHENEDGTTIMTGMSYSDGGVAIDRLLGKSIDAVFAFTDTLAIGAMNRLTSMGRRVPEDIAVAGFSGTIISSIVNPQLTTVEPPQYAIGQTAARLVLDLINGKQPEKKEVTLDAEIIYRKSTE